MNVESHNVVTVERVAGHRPQPQPRYEYSLYGLHVRSEIDLPLVGTAPIQSSSPDVVVIDGGSEPSTPDVDGVITFELRCNCPDHRGQVVTRVTHGSEKTRVWNDAAGTCDIASDGRSVVIYSRECDDPERWMLAHLMTGIVSTILIYQRLGVTSLHASGVIVDECAAVFLGPKGQGKSTMAAGFLRRGASLLTDDLLPLQIRDDGIYGVPGMPHLKLWDESIEHALQFSGEHLPSVVPNFPKRFLKTSSAYPMAANPVRLTALYVLDRYDPELAPDRGIAITPLKPGDAMMTVLAQTPLHSYLPAKSFARALPILTRLIKQASVKVVSFPSGFAFQDIVHERILADVRESQ